MYSMLSPTHAPQFRLCIVCNDYQLHVSKLSPVLALEDVLNSDLQSWQTAELQKTWPTTPNMQLAAQKRPVQDAPLSYLFLVGDHGNRKLVFVRPSVTAIY